MCCVMPPASPLATRVRRIVSSSDVLPWSTWPITVTTGGRGSGSAVCVASVSASSASGSSSLAAFALWPISSTTIIAVSWSSTWLIVTIEPIFISALITSAAFTDILCARSATVIVSGTEISRTMRACRRSGPGMVSPASSSRRWRPPLAPRQPVAVAPPVVSPRSLSARRRAASSWNTWPGPSSLPSRAFRRACAAGRCSVPSVPAGFARSRGFPSAAAAASAAAFASSAAFASAAARAAASSASFSFLVLRFAASSCFFCRSSCWRAISSWALRSSASRAATSSADSIGAGAAAGVGASSTTGAGAAGAASPSSRVTNTRFLRTSTWIVRALPVESAALISVVCLRVSVIRFFGSAAAPCCLRR